MSNPDDAFLHATDGLISLYRNLERRTLDLPWVSAMPLLIFLWSVLKFYFFVLIGIPLIIPVNLIILIRNLFPGHWRYRPFFLAHIYYIWLWIWRGEVPTAPFIFIRPLLNLFMTAHFERRVRRLRLEVVLNDSLSDTTRPALLARLDAALERWRTPRFAALFFTVILPTIIAVPTYYKQLFEFLGSFGIPMPTDVIVHYVTEKVSTGFWTMILALSVPGYLLAIPVTAFLAKRGLFLEIPPNRICFPGGQGGTGIYSKEREILSSVGLRVPEMRVDLWISGSAVVLAYLLVVLVWDRYVAWIQSFNPAAEASWNLLIQVVVQAGLFVVAFFISAVRRGRTGRL